jgi:ATP-dependent helicase/nuclease subunit A
VDPVASDDVDHRSALSGIGYQQGDPVKDTESLEEMNRNQQEARLAIPRIRDLVRSGLHYRDLVVLTRTRAVGLVWRDVLEKADLPVVSDAGSGFLDTPAMRLAESLIHALDNQRQDIPLAAVMHAGIFGEAFSLDDLAAIRLFGKKARPDKPFFHQAVFAYRQNGTDDNLRQRVRDFLDWMDQLRHREQTLRLSELVDLALLDSGWLDRVAAGPDGPAEVRRLRQFRLWTEQFEKNRRQGLYRFARHLESLRRRGPLESPVSLADTDQDAIRIMTIHGSKGLEFPVVILAGTGFSIRSKDAQDHVLISEALGIGMDYADPERQVRYPSLLKQAMLDEIRATGMAEELRLLYVAMTRAMDRLIIVGSVKPGSSSNQNRLQNLLTQARACAGQRLPDYLVLSAKSYLEWLLLALARKPELAEIIDRLAVADAEPTDLSRQIYPWSLSCRTLASLGADPLGAEPAGTDSLSADLLSTEPAGTDSSQQLVPDEQQMMASSQPEPDEGLTTVEAWLRLRGSLAQRITQPYRLERAARTPIKLSVSELKRREQDLSDPEWRDGEAMRLTDFTQATNPSGIDLDLRPMLHEDDAELADEPMKGSRLGTLLHTVFRYLDLVSARSNPCAGEIDRQLRLMVELGMILPEDLAVVQAYRRQILVFVQSALAREIVAAMTTPDGRAFVEMPFTLTLPACQIYNPCDGLDPDDRVLVQGMIDCWYRIGDRITLIDYKTDRIQGDDEACGRELQRRYSGQLAYYAQAIETAAGQPVTQRVIWHIGRACRFDIPS